MKKKDLKEEIVRLNKELKDSKSTIINILLSIEPYAQNKNIFKSIGIGWETDVQEYVFMNEVQRVKGKYRPYMYLSTINGSDIKLNLLSDDIERDFKDAINRLQNGASNTILV